MKKFSNKKDSSDLVMIDPSIFKALENCVEANEAVLMIGETGTGKTTIVRELAKKSGKKVVRVPLTGSTGIDEILGKWLAKNGSTVWQDGILVEAMKRGDWIVFDEINAALPEVLFALHPLLDEDRHVLLAEKDNEQILPHDEFRFFATMNPSAEYAGTKDMNKALISRFNAVIKVAPLAEQFEAELLIERYKVEPDMAAKLAAISTALRAMKQDEKIFYFCSTRDIVQAGRLVSSGMSLKDALLFSIGNKMSNEDYNEAAQVVSELTQRQHRRIDVAAIENELQATKARLRDVEHALAVKTQEADLLRTEASKLSSEVATWRRKYEMVAIRTIDDLVNRNSEDKKSV